VCGLVGDRLQGVGADFFCIGVCEQMMRVEQKTPILLLCVTKKGMVVCNRNSPVPLSLMLRGIVLILDK
jgi:hypothetical protein